VPELSKQWQARPEAGTRSGLKLLLWVARRLGRPVLHAILLPVSTYFCLTRRPERRASFDYLSRIHRRPATFDEVLRHFYAFAKVTADRFYFLSGQADAIPVRFVIDPRLHQVLASGRAGIFLAAHFGSFEAARVLGPELGGIELRIVLDKAVNGRFIAAIAEVEPELHGLIIDSAQDTVALGLNIGDALKAGAWVGFLADRHRQGDRTAAQRFLGQTALFPSGPYVIASVFKAPVISAFCRLTTAGYEIHCEVLSECFNPSRAERNAAIEALMSRYVARLETHVKACPNAWFNFFDFWAPR